MLLHEVMILSELKGEDEKQQGTYVAVKFDDDTIKRLESYIKDNDIPNAVKSSKFHTTVIYSRKYCPDLKSKGKMETEWVGKPKKLEIWENGDKTSKCLVLTYDCPELSKRHKQLMTDHKATYDFPDYKPHVTLSYDVGDRNVDDFTDIDDIGDIRINNEYHQDLDLNWSEKATKDD